MLPPSECKRSGQLQLYSIVKVQLKNEPNKIYHTPVLFVNITFRNIRKYSYILIIKRLVVVMVMMVVMVMNCLSAMAVANLANRANDAGGHGGAQRATQGKGACDSGYQTIAQGF